MDCPTNLMQLHSFLGSVQYYRDHWPKKAHVLAPLTDLTGCKQFTWKANHQTAFEQMKSLMTVDALLHYTDLNKPFDIETDSSDYQLGAVIKQDGHPIAYYSRKLNKAQQNYTTIKKELLSIIKTLKTFQSMLLGGDICIYTDHKNLMHSLTAFTTQCVLCWRLYLEEYGPSFHYIHGPNNRVANALSWVLHRDTPLVGEKLTASNANDNFFFLLLDEPELAECLLVHPEFDDEGRYPLTYKTICEYQLQDAALQQLAQNVATTKFASKNLSNTEVICYIPPGDPTDWEIAILDGMLDKLVLWYHLSIGHVSVT